MKGERMTSLLVEHVCFHCRRNLYLDYQKGKQAAPILQLVEPAWYWTLI